MLGAIVGDVVGSIREWEPIKTKNFTLLEERNCPTDDSVLTVAVAEVVLDGGDYVDAFHTWFHRFPGAGYGERFHAWAEGRHRHALESWGNGSAMRVSPIGWAFDTIDAVRAEARRSAEVTHGHAEGLTGACAVAEAVMLARHQETKDRIRKHIEGEHGYDLSRPLDAYRRRYQFEVRASRSVPQALRCFLEATDYVDALRNAVSMGGDADTMAAIAGSVAEAWFGVVPPALYAEVEPRLDPTMLAVIDRFRLRFGT